MFGVAQLGFGRSLMKYIAKYKAYNDYDSISKLSQTIFISVFILIGVVSVISYPLLLSLLEYSIEGEEVLLAKDILWIVILIFFIKNTFGIYTSLLDGLQRMDVRGIIVIFSTIVFFVLTIILVPHYNIYGVIYAQLVQAVIPPVFSVIFLKYKYKKIKIFPVAWSKKLFLETYSYGMKFQFISICQMLIDPLAKALLSKFGGLSTVTYYEMANKMLSHLRLLVVYAADSIIPVVAELFEKDPSKIKTVYRKTYDLVFIVSISGFLMIAISSPFISYLWIGEVNELFVLFVSILSLSILLSSLSMPAYQVNMGTGRLKANLLSNLILSVLNVSLGYALGYLYQGIGVVIGLSISIFISACIVFYYFFKENNLGYSSLVSRENKQFFLISISTFITLFLFNVFFYEREFFLIINLASSLIYSAFVLFALWHNKHGIYIIRKILKR